MNWVKRGEDRTGAYDSPFQLGFSCGSLTSFHCVPLTLIHMEHLQSRGDRGESWRCEHGNRGGRETNERKVTLEAFVQSLLSLLYCSSCCSRFTPSHTVEQLGRSKVNDGEPQNWWCNREWKVGDNISCWLIRTKMYSFLPTESGSLYYFSLRFTFCSHPLYKLWGLRRMKSWVKKRNNWPRKIECDSRVNGGRVQPWDSYVSPFNLMNGTENGP